MRIAEFSVQRPVFTTMMALIVIVLGLSAVMRLPIDLMPEVSNPTLTVATSYGNASPEEIETLITQYVEQAVAAVPGVTEITSDSAEGVSNVSVRFDWGTDLDVASNDIRDRLDRILGQLPPDVTRPVLRKFDVAAFPILILGIASDLDPIELRTLIDDQLSYRIERVPGVASVDIWGGLAREVQVNLDIEKVKALGIPLNGIIQRLRDSNINVPAGSFERGNFDVTLRTPGEYENVEEIANTVVFIRDGAPIHLRQVATVQDTHERIVRMVRINGQPGVRVAVRKQSGTNTVEVADRVLAEVERLNRDFPQVRVKPVIDSSQYIRRAIDNVTDSVIYGGALAVLVLFFFLRSLRSTLVISTAIPVSIIASFGLMYGGGFTLNLMTLGGLALGVGMMVDNAIVVLENIFRVRKDHPGINAAATNGTQEVTAAIIASTITTLVIFLPLFFIEGAVGIMFKQLAMVVSFSLLCSLGVALTMVPMLASKFLGNASGGASSGPLGALKAVSGRVLGAMEEQYNQLLSAALRARLVTVTVAVALCAGSTLLVPLIGREFLPKGDEGEVRVTVEAEVGTRLDLINKLSLGVEEVIAREVPEAVNTVVNMGASSFGAGDASRSSIQVAVGTIRTRQRSSEEIANDLRRKIGQIPGAVVRVRAGEGLRVLRLGENNQGITIEVRGYDLQVLDAIASQVQEAVTGIPGVTDVRLAREAGKPQELVRIDRDRVADVGLTVAQVAQALETAIAGSRAGRFRDAGNEYNIRVRLADSERLNLEEILDLVITNAAGQAIVLRNVVVTEPRLGPQLIKRKNQGRISDIEVNVAGRDQGSVVRDIQEKLKAIPLPADYAMVITGDYEEQQKAFRELILSMVLALLLVYMVLASLYESLLDPLIVMFSVPLAGIGVFVTLFLSDMTFNAQSFIGCILLGGIVVNNAILIVDQAGTLLRGGMTPREAVQEAGRRRLRPILMTTLTTVLGLLPMAVGIGEGSEAQAPLARVVIGGLVSSTIITLFFIPVLYSLMHRARKPEAASPAETIPIAETARA